MSDIGAMVAELIASGAAPEAAARIVASAFTAGVAAAIPRNSTGVPVDEVAEKRRAYDRNRKRKSTGIPPESTGTPVETANASLSIEKERGNKKEKKERAQASQLPPEWRPSPESWAEACALLGSDDRAELELKKFKNHASEKGRLAKNWNSAWANWAIKAVEYGGRNGHASSNSRAAGTAGPTPTGADTILAGMGRIADRIAARKLAERQDDLDLAVEPDPRSGRA